MYLLRGNDAALTQLDALPKVLSAIGGSFRLNRIINRDFRVDSTVPAGNQMVDGMLEVFLAGDAGESFKRPRQSNLHPALMSSALTKSTNTWCFPSGGDHGLDVSLRVLTRCPTEVYCQSSHGRAPGHDRARRPPGGPVRALGELDGSRPLSCLEWEARWTSGGRHVALLSR